MDDDLDRRTPWHLWVVGLITLLWNAFGGYDYTMSQLRDRAYLEGSMAPMGVSYDEIVAFLDNFPVWVDALWALGVWGSLAGSLLLLLRSRIAVPAYLLSLIGSAGSIGYQFTSDLPPAMAASSASMIMPIVIMVVILAQLLYAWRIRASGVLR